MITRLSKKITNILTGWYKHLFGEYDIRMYKRRKAICNDCEYNNKKLDLCRICLCPLKAKLKVEDESCPLMRWSSENINNV